MNKKIAGLIIISVALLSMFIWEFWGRENLSYKEVLVFREDVKAHTVISEDDLSTKRIENPAASSLTGKDMQWLIGKEMAQYVPAGSALVKEFFTESQYNTGGSKGKHILCVPEDWLLSFPRGIRRGDQVSFYNGRKKLLDAVVIHAYDSSGTEVTSKDSDRLTSEGVVSRIEIISSAEKLLELSSVAGKGKKLTVIYD